MKRRFNYERVFGRIKNRVDGFVIDVIKTTDDYDEAYVTAKIFNEDNIEGFNVNLPIDNYTDGTEGLIADIYETEYEIEED